MSDTQSSDLIGQRALRIEKMKKLKDLGIDPYPAKSYKGHLNSEITSNFSDFEGKEVILSGRVASKRGHGKLVFMDMVDDSGKIQVYIKDDELSGTDASDKEVQYIGFENLDLVDIADYIEVTGEITKTERGEISILAKRLRMLTKTIRPLPTNLEDKEERFRRRYVDMKVHPEVKERMKRRALFWEAHREFFNKEGFYEINIPVLEHVPGGGDAVPFTTHMNAIDEDFFLRISHELPLKRLIGAGFEKVYDIGARFRNEGLSDEHLPEHNAMEFYWAYADWKDGMKMIQDLFNYVVSRVYPGQTKFQIREFEIEFKENWDILDFNEVMKERYGIKDVYTITLEEVKELLTKNGIAFERSINIPRGVDALWKKIRKTVAGPAFLVNHPKYLSPLQKPSLDNPEMVERFQPIIAGSELGNGWSELNDPIEQYERFLEQQKLRDSGDEEAQWLDIDYVEMLEYGMAPTFGYGHSERVFWFLENVTAREGVPFPQLKQEFDELTKKIYPEVFDDKSPSLEGGSGRVTSDEKPIQQDFSNKIAIVVNEELESWKVLNTVAHVSAYLGHKLDKKFGTAENFVTKDGKIHPRNSQYAIVVLKAKPGQMTNFMEKVRAIRQAQGDKFLYHGFIKEMIETTDDSEITEILSNKTDSEIEYLGIGVYGDNETLKKLTNKFSLWK